MRGSAAIGFLLRWLSLSMIVAEVSPKICASVLSYVCVFLGSGYVLHTTDSGGAGRGCAVGSTLRVVDRCKENDIDLLCRCWCQLASLLDCYLDYTLGRVRPLLWA